MGNSTAFNVYNDPLAASLGAAPHALTLTDLIEHPVALTYLALFLEPQARHAAVMRPLCSRHAVDTSVT